MRISIHVLRVEDDRCRWYSLAYFAISIHVLRVEDDQDFFAPYPHPLYFNPRPPCGGRHRMVTERFGHLVFQSTSSVWRTTHCRQPAHLQHVISIHVLRVEDDISLCAFFPFRSDFNPRPPCGGRPRICRLRKQYAPISIHVLRVEDDGIAIAAFAAMGYFNPRPPCGGRRRSSNGPCPMAEFQSTSSVWRTTTPCSAVRPGRHISIHVLRVEDDSPSQQRPQWQSLFQSTSSVWRTTDFLM